MFERAEKTIKLVNLFRSTNDVLTYEAIERHMGEPINDMRQLITNVRKYLERDEGVVFACIHKEGYRRLSDAEKVESSAGFQRKIRRTAVRGVMRIDAVSNFAALSNQDQLSATIRKSVFETVQRAAAAKA